MNFKANKTILTRVKRIQSPINSLPELFSWNPNFRAFEKNNDVQILIKNRCRPIVTSIDWTVCFEQRSGRFFRVDNEGVREVHVCCILSRNLQGDFVTSKNEKLVTQTSFDEFCPNADFHGESDDISLYIWFSFQNKSIFFNN